MRISSALPRALAAATFCIAPNAYAQTPAVGVSLQHGIERYAGDATLNRLDGGAMGLAAFGSVTRGSLLLRLEGSVGGHIDDIQTLIIDANGRPVTIHSNLTHAVNTLSVLAGFTHRVSPRLRLAYLGGIAFMSVGRTFSTNAGGALLVAPSTAGASSTHTIDRFSTVSVGADLVFQVKGRMHLTTGVRIEPMTLGDDVTGYRIRSLVGVAWALR